jgi:hypothetical protein
MKKLLISSVVSVSLGLTGCMSSNVTTTVFPQGNDQYKSTSLSSVQGDAEKDSLAKATETCTKKGKELVVINQQSVHQGEKKAEVKGEGAAAIASAALGIFGDRSKEQKNNDYKTELTFTCK